MHGLLLTATPPIQDPDARQAVGQLSSALLTICLIGVVLVFTVVLLALRRRSRARLEARQHADPGDAWTEAGKRIDLEDDEEIPREPGSA